jgi:hypothetical protein
MQMVTTLQECLNKASRLGISLLSPIEVLTDCDAIKAHMMEYKEEGLKVSENLFQHLDRDTEYDRISCIFSIACQLGFIAPDTTSPIAAYKKSNRGNMENQVMIFLGKVANGEYPMETISYKECVNLPGGKFITLQNQLIMIHVPTGTKIIIDCKPTHTINGKSPIRTFYQMENLQRVESDFKKGRMPKGDLSLYDFLHAKADGHIISRLVSNNSENGFKDQYSAIVSQPKLKNTEKRTNDSSNQKNDSAKTRGNFLLVDKSLPPLNYSVVVDGKLSRKANQPLYSQLIRCVENFIFFKVDHEVTTKIDGSGTHHSMDLVACEQGITNIPLIFKQLLEVRVNGKQLQVTTPVTCVALTENNFSMMVGFSYFDCKVEKSFMIRSIVSNGKVYFKAHNGAKDISKVHKFTSDLLEVINSIIGQNNYAHIDLENKETCFRISDDMYLPHNYWEYRLENELWKVDADSSLGSYLSGNYISLNSSFYELDCDCYEQIKKMMNYLLPTIKILQSQGCKIIRSSLFENECDVNIQIIIGLHNKYATISVDDFLGELYYGITRKADNVSDIQPFKVENSESLTSLLFSFLDDDPDFEADQVSLDQLEMELLLQIEIPDWD